MASVTESRMRISVSSAELSRAASAFAKERDAAATFDVDDPGDGALLALSEHCWFPYFIALSFSLALAETILVGWGPDTLEAQKVVLAASSLLFVIGYLATLKAMPHAMKFWDRLQYAVLDETWIELVCFAIGWGLIFQEPAMATLRCFRIFRFVW